MPRPQKEGLDYFPHDTDACSDEKVEALRILYGNDGYAFYFILLERIYRTPNGELGVSDAETIQILCRKIEVTEQVFRSMLETALKRGVFCRESYDSRGVLTSNGIKKRIEPVMRKRLKMKEYYDSKIVSDAETLPETEQKRDKEKKSKEKKSKEKKSKNPCAFLEFWNAYPKKKSKGAAEKAWKSLSPDKSLKSLILEKIDLAKKTDSWIRDGGKFIPYPATWLRSKGWEDEISEEVNGNDFYKKIMAEKYGNQDD